MRYVHEALPHMRQKYRPSAGGDPNAMPYSSELSADHPLVSIARILTVPDLPEDMFLSKYADRKVPRNDKDFQVVLHKEVHALLASEGLVKELRCPTLVITRDPIYSVDSLLSYQGLESPYLRHESVYIQETTFLWNAFSCDAHAVFEYLQRFPDDGVHRQNVETAKVLTAAIINAVLSRLADRFSNVMRVRYEDLILDPVARFNEIAVFFGLEFGPHAQRQLEKTLSSRNEEAVHYSIFRDTRKQLNRPLKWITEDSIERIRAVLEECRLSQCLQEDQSGPQ